MRSGSPSSYRCTSLSLRSSNLRSDDAGAHERASAWPETSSYEFMGTFLNVHRLASRACSTNWPNFLARPMA